MMASDRFSVRGVVFKDSSDMDLYQLTVPAARDLLVRRQVSSVELTRAVLDRIETVEPRVRAFVTLTPELALDQAAAADRLFAANPCETLPLTGIPGAIKDVIVTRGGSSSSVHV